jgi:glycosidase
MRCLFLLALTLVTAMDTAASADVIDQPVIERNGSELSIDWNSPSGGIWQILDERDRICASGRISEGQNSLNMPKVASPSDLKLRLVSSNGNLSTYNMPGTRNVSPLRKPSRAVIIYQVPTRTYIARGNGRNESGRLVDLTRERLREIKQLGVDYLWMTGVLEHASRAQVDPDVVKGDAGSYYAIYDNWDVSGQIGSLADFEALIERAHAEGLRVIIDFVANHTARVHKTDVLCKQVIDFGRDDNTNIFFDSNNNYYYIQNSSFTPPQQNNVPDADGIFDTDIFSPGVQLEAPARVTGNDMDTATPAIYDWFETAKLNYGYDFRTHEARYSPRPKTWYQMIDVAKYWVEKGVDGFRVDFAHAIPIEFWRYFASELRQVDPDVYLMAEAYEGDYRMKLPGFSYYAMLDAGFDSVYDSESYWAMHDQVGRPGNMRSANPMRMPAFNSDNLRRGFMFTRYMENHDEIRLASRHFAPWIGDRGQRANLGLAYTTYLTLLPGHMMLHGGQELQEDASVFGGYAGDNGRSSIFDYVYQAQTRIWNYSTRPQWMVDFRERYRKLIEIKKNPAFSVAHSTSMPSYIDLDAANAHKDQAKWVAAYLRFFREEVYLVVTNGDPFVSHEATIHFTYNDGQDPLGALGALEISNSDERWKFTEVFSREGWVPQDPAISGAGVPGWVLYRSGNVPSGLFLGSLPPATTYVFKVTRS